MLFIMMLMVMSIFKFLEHKNKMTMMEIKSVSNEIIYTGKALNFRKLLFNAIKDRVNFCEVNLSGMDLFGVNFSRFMSIPGL